MSVVPARKIWNSQLPLNSLFIWIMNCLIKDQNLFQSAAMLSDFYCQIINLMTRPYGKCPSSGN